MVLITIVNGVYKPTYNWGAHIEGLAQIVGKMVRKCPKTKKKHWKMMKKQMGCAVNLSIYWDTDPEDNRHVSYSYHHYDHDYLFVSPFTLSLNNYIISGWWFQPL